MCRFVGYFGYELKALCGGSQAHSSSLPDSALFFADRLVAIDHSCGDLYVLGLRRATEADGDVLQWIQHTEKRALEILEGTAGTRQPLDARCGYGEDDYSSSIVGQ